MLRATTELLPAEKPRFIHGMCTPGGAPPLDKYTFPLLPPSVPSSPFIPSLPFHSSFPPSPSSLLPPPFPPPSPPPPLSLPFPLLLSPAEEIFTAVECGVDVFDGSYPYTISEQGCALTFLHQLTTQHEREKGEEGEEKQPYSISLKEDKYVFEPTSLSEYCCTSTHLFILVQIRHRLLTGAKGVRVLHLPAPQQGLYSPSLGHQRAPRWHTAHDVRPHQDFSGTFLLLTHFLVLVVK